MLASHAQVSPVLLSCSSTILTRKQFMVLLRALLLEAEAKEAALFTRIR